VSQIEGRTNFSSHSVCTHGQPSLRPAMCGHGPFRYCRYG